MHLPEVSSPPARALPHLAHRGRLPEGTFMQIPELSRRTTRTVPDALRNADALGGGGRPSKFLDAIAFWGSIQLT